jgi:threonine dehydratase
VRVAAAVRDIPCHVVMPSSAPTSKRRAAEACGAVVVSCDPTLEAREEALTAVVARTGATEVHPYDHPDVIAGQGTATLELLGDVAHLDAVIAPVSGGGLLSGAAMSADTGQPAPANPAELRRPLTYGECRARFRRAAAVAGATVEPHPIDATGPDR